MRQSMMNRSLRVCRVCGLEIFIEEDLGLFAKDKRGKYGRMNRCKKCSNKRNKKYREDNPEKFKEYDKKYREKNLERIKERQKKYKKKYRKTNREKLNEISKKYYEAHPFSIKLSRLKGRSNKNGLAFDLDLEYLEQLWGECGGICPMTGISMLKTSVKNDPYTMSLDRIIPEKGYIKGNVRLVCLWYNRARNNYGDKLTIEMCQRVIKQTHAEVS